MEKKDWIESTTAQRAGMIRWFIGSLMSRRRSRNLRYDLNLVGCSARGIVFLFAPTKTSRRQYSFTVITRIFSVNALPARRTVGYALIIPYFAQFFTIS